MNKAGIASAVAEARKRLGHSLEAAAREIGVSWVTVWAWEHGQEPTLHNFEKIMAYVQASKKEAQHGTTDIP